MFSSLRKLMKQGLIRAGYRTGQAFTPGVAVFGYTLFADPYPVAKTQHSTIALAHALRQPGSRVLDVGSGGGKQAQAFLAGGKSVVCIDFGTSVYANERVDDGLQVIHTDFLQYQAEHLYDIVWASHVLEHQRDVGRFLQHLCDCCRPGGLIYVTVPDPHRQLWGGHLSVWSPGLLAYNTVLCGLDLSESACLRGIEEFTLVFRLKQAALPSLSYDKGDLQRLQGLLPPEVREDAGGWQYWDRLSA